MSYQDNQQVIEYIREHTLDFHAEVGLILGSGLGNLAEEIFDPLIIPYSSIPHFPQSSVEGHINNLILGSIDSVNVACLSGRVHMYEGVKIDKIKLMVRTLKMLGCHTLFITNAAGSLHYSMELGELSLIKDHINLQGFNPLMGENDNEFGTRFFPLTNAYDLELQNIIKNIAQNLDIKIHEGIYAAVLGPSFETPAEIRAFRNLGADLVGMSTVPEVLVARHCNMKVCAISIVSNFASGMKEEHLAHETHLQNVEQGSDNLKKIMKQFVCIFKKK